MDNYIKNILEAGKVYEMNDYRTIMTDRMGGWNNQELRLAWEGDGKDRDTISISPDEAEILFEKGLLKYVQRDYKGNLYIPTYYCDVREFDGAIVCGMLSPSSIMRNGIREYTKKMGYILDKPTPVEMFNGTKSLICNENGTYKITYKWSDEVLGKFNMEAVQHFTRRFWKREFDEARACFSDKKFYESPILTVSEKEFSVDNMSEKETFDRISIDAFREYDIQLKLLSPAIDRVNVLKALIYLAFACDSSPLNIQMRYEESFKHSKLFLNLPLTQYTPVLSQKCKSVKLHSGTAIYCKNDCWNETYYYKIDVPYCEGIRRLMRNFATLMNTKYENNYFRVSFNPLTESVEFLVWNMAVGHFGNQLEDEFAILDYAITIYQNLKDLNYHQMLATVLKFFASDISLPYKETFEYYYDWLYRNLKTSN